ncbi:MAG: Do family serine endopeptidase [Hyphomonadaceae bacterium]|nr:Do family serine endopeptidase [Hyphomonadaceae bacterium]
MAKRFGVSAQALVAGMVGAGAMAAFTFGPQFTSPADARQIVIEAPGDAPVSFADLIEQVSPAVVSVNVVSLRDDSSGFEEFMERFRDMPGFDEYMERRRDEEGESEPEQREARSLGSGFFISADGYIVTNNHVVEGATEIEIALDSGEELEAEIVGTDPQTDLAVLKVIEPGTYPYVEFAHDADMRRGDWVVALGNPFGLGGTATAGIISAQGRRNQLGRSSTYTDFLQIDAAINRGNSGGPTFDLHGRVVGVNTAIFSPTGGSVGIGFAIPADLANQITSTLIRDGRVSRGWLGVTIQDLTPDMAEAQGLAEDEGAIVADVADGGPAEEYGLERGDIILSVNGSDVADATELTRMVGSLLAGSDNQFGVLRDGEQITVSVTVGERPEDPYGDVRPAASDDTVTEDTEGPLGVSVKPLNENLRQELNLDEDEVGLVITEMESDSPLRDAQIRSGMAILEINGRPLSSEEDMRQAIEGARLAGRDKVLVAVRVGEVTTFRTVEIGETDD